jgi:uncharacterized protein YerC
MELWDPAVIELKKMLDDPTSFDASDANDVNDMKASRTIDPLFSDVAGQRLIEAFLAARTGEEVGLFLKDLLTINQIDYCKKKLNIAFMLTDGIPFGSIESSMGATPQMMASISKRLKTHEGGYNIILAKLYPAKFT